MRSYRDAKILAQSLRHALLDKKNVYLGQGESLEIVSHMFGLRDWNTLAAIIKKTPVSRPQSLSKTSSPQLNSPGAEPAYRPEDYEGAFRMESGIIEKVFSGKDGLSTQISGYAPVMFSYSGSDCFVSEKSGIRLNFFRNIEDQVAGYTCYQTGYITEWKRITLREAEDLIKALKKRIAENTPVKSTEKMLRHLIQGLITGNPDYEVLGNHLAEAVKEQLEFTQSCLSAAGQVMSVTFIGVQDDGADAFHVRHKHRLFRWSIGLNDEATKIVLAGFVSGG
jgi:hypothetical protein